MLDDFRLAEDDTQDDQFRLADDVATLVTIPMAPSTLEIGKHDLVTELDGPVLNDFAPVPAEARISRDFIRGIFMFGPSCPSAIVDQAIDLILDHWHQFSWHEMDLGCITDVPYDTKYVDESPCVCKSRRHNYSDRNATIIEAKSV